MAAKLTLHSTALGDIRVYEKSVIVDGFNPIVTDNPDEVAHAIRRIQKEAFRVGESSAQAQMRKALGL